MNNSYEASEVVEIGKAENLILGNPKTVGIADSSSDPLQFNGADDSDE